jgi:hypothetical protein
MYQLLITTRLTLGSSIMDTQTSMETDAELLKRVSCTMSRFEGEYRHKAGRVETKT